MTQRARVVSSLLHSRLLLVPDSQVSGKLAIQTECAFYLFDILLRDHASHPSFLRFPLPSPFPCQLMTSRGTFTIGKRSFCFSISLYTSRYLSSTTSSPRPDPLPFSFRFPPLSLPFLRPRLILFLPFLALIVTSVFHQTHAFQAPRRVSPKVTTHLELRLRSARKQQANR